MSRRVGPYEVVREIVHAPGATFAEGRSPEGEPRLIQLVRLRAANGDLERVERQRHERQIAQRTTELVTEGNFLLHAHGGTDLVESGERLLFWVLPWIDGTLFLDRAKERPLVVGEVIRSALQLAERMVVRHTWNRVDPLLSEHLLYGGQGEKIDIAGVPICALTKWLAPGMASPRLAPEEERTEDRRASGDLWRLGTLLRELSRFSDPLPIEARETFDALAQPDLTHRTGSATLAAAAFQRIWSARADGNSAVFAELLSFRGKASSSSERANGAEAESGFGIEATLPDPLSIVSWDIPAEALPDQQPTPETRVPEDVRATVEMTKPTDGVARTGADEANTPPPEPTLDVLETVTMPAVLGPHDTPVELSFDPEAVTKQAEPLAPGPAPEAQVMLIAESSTEPDRPKVESNKGAEDTDPVDRASGAGRTDNGGRHDTTEQADWNERTELLPKQAPSFSGAAAVAVLSAHDTLVEQPVGPSVEGTVPDLGSGASTTPSTAPKANGHGGANGNGNGQATERSIDPIAASWVQPVLPSGESPWSEVVQPRGTHQRDRTAFPGFAEEIPVPARSESRPAISRPEPPAFDTGDLPSRQEYKDVATSEIQVEIAAAFRGVKSKKIVSAVLLLLVTIGFFLLLARNASHDSPAKQVRIATPANEVALDSDPPGATVVAEVDGAILGKTPLKFLVPPGSGASVFLTSPSREPVRVTLPERGGIKAQLAQIEEGSCEVKLTSIERVMIEGIDVDIGPGPLRKIPGAALVRAKPGQRLSGARLVLCPLLGGAKEQELRLDPKAQAIQVRLVQPDGDAAYVNGESLGNVPVSIDAQPGFSWVRVTDQRGNSEERWVATLTPTEVRMPLPRPAPIAPPPPQPDSEQGGAENAPKADEPPSAVLAKAEAAPDPSAGAQAKRERPVRTKQLLRAGTKLLNAGRVQKAKEVLAECVELDPAAADCHKNLGILYRRVRSTYKAREHLTRYLELVPDAPDAQRIKKMLE